MTSGYFYWLSKLSAPSSFHRMSVPGNPRGRNFTRSEHIEHGKHIHIFRMKQQDEKT